MINFLTSALPASVTVRETEYPIRTDFRIWIKIHSLLQKDDISSIDKAVDFFALAFTGKTLPPSVEEALVALSDFLSPVIFKNGNGGEKNAPSFSFEYDGGMIYSAFLSQYGIDLLSSQLHWWQFLALFYSLGNCLFTSAVAARNADLSSVKDPKQKQVLRKQKKFFAIPDRKTDIGDELNKLF